MLAGYETIAVAIRVRLPVAERAEGVGMVTDIAQGSIQAYSDLQVAPLYVALGAGVSRQSVDPVE